MQSVIISWSLFHKYVDIIFKDLMSSDLYKEYMSTKLSTYKEDKEFVISIFEDIIAPSDKLYDYFEDKKYCVLPSFKHIAVSFLTL